jgi:hypothetical protein
MSIIHPQDFFPSDNYPVWFNVWWRDHSDLFLRSLWNVKYLKPAFGSSLSGNLLIYPKEPNRMESEMNGRKSNKHGAGLGNGDGKSLPFQWINVQLTPEDLNLLSAETVDIEQLAYSFIGLGMRGLGLSVKYDSTRKSYAVSIYGSDSANNDRPCGISGAASDLRDALLVSLFRFNSCLQGSFDGRTNTDTVFQSGRFR